MKNLILIFLFFVPFYIFSQKSSLIPSELADFKIKTEENIKDLQNNISNIASKKTRLLEKVKIIKSTLLFFMEGSKIQVSNLEKRIIEPYYRRLS